jgi:hypothetical protein
MIATNSDAASIGSKEGDVLSLGHTPLTLKGMWSPCCHTMASTGQMIQLASGKHLMYLCSPYVTNIQDLLQHNMRLNNIPLYDATRDLILLNQQRLNEVGIK